MDSRDEQVVPLAEFSHHDHPLYPDGNASAFADHAQYFPTGGQTLYHGLGCFQYPQGMYAVGSDGHAPTLDHLLSDFQAPALSPSTAASTHSSWYNDLAVPHDNSQFPNPLALSSASTPRNPFVESPIDSLRPKPRVEVEIQAAAASAEDESSRTSQSPDMEEIIVAEPAKFSDKRSPKKAKSTSAPKRTSARVSKSVKALKPSKDPQPSTTSRQRTHKPRQPSSTISSFTDQAAVNQTSPPEAATTDSINLAARPSSSALGAPSPHPPHTQRDRNRAAATKCRARTKAAAERLEEVSRTETEIHSDLLAEVASLKDQVLLYRTAILAHADCDCKVIQSYVRNAAMTIAETGGAWVSWGPDGNGREGEMGDDGDSP